MLLPLVEIQQAPRGGGSQDLPAALYTVSKDRRTKDKPDMELRIGQLLER